MNKPSCETCRTIYKKRKVEPPCDTCKEVLLIENEEALKVYLASKDQLIIAQMTGKIIDIDNKAIKVAMDIYKVKDQARCFDKVRAMFHKLLEEQE